MTAASMMILMAIGSATLGSQREKILIRSSLDQTEQPSYLILPDGFDRSGPPVPLLVSLHTWSSTLEKGQRGLEKAAEERGWIYLYPNFRGRNDTPDACGSLKAQQDILDAVEWTCQRYPVDKRRIYLTGASGGGHMTMLMAGRHPQVWAAASAWVGISDLAAWYKFQEKSGYGAMARKCCGGAPGDSPAVDAEYRARSPKTWLAAAVDLPLDLGAGVHDGHKGSVPIRQTLDAFNVLAKAQGLPVITEEEIARISRPNGRLEKPQSSDQEPDPTFGRAIYLRRTAGKARVTIFEGGHERLDRAAIEWLSKHAKP